MSSDDAATAVARSLPELSARAAGHAERIRDSLRGCVGALLEVPEAAQRESVRDLGAASKALVAKEPAFRGIDKASALALPVY